MELISNIGPIFISTLAVHVLLSLPLKHSNKNNYLNRSYKQLIVCKNGVLWYAISSN